jgi:predicted dienelactone hydrolase
MKPALLFLLLVPLQSRAADYDPLALPPATEQPRTIDLQLQDPARKREIPLRLYLPAAKSPAPVVLFSHGLGGSREGSAFLGAHWSARGYVVVYVQHPGSDDAIWKDTPPAQRMASLQRAASAENLALRAADVKATLDALALWNKQPAHDLAGRLDLDHVGMSGHSFGAVTTQAVSGQSYALAGQRFTDPRIKAAIPMSPSTPRLGKPDQAFAAVKIPWLLMTGTRDTAPVGNQTVESRRAVYPNLPATIDKYELVLNDAEHSVFTDRALPGDKAPRNPKHHASILALSTAFWDANLRSDPAARAWLNGPQARSAIEESDHWQLHLAEKHEP